MVYPPGMEAILVVGVCHVLILALLGLERILSGR